MNERVCAPLGRRLCEVVGARDSGGYRIFTALDANGPEPAAGQFYMVAAERGWASEGGRPYLARAFSVAQANVVDDGVHLDFLADAVGPGTARLCRLEAGEALWLAG